MLENNIRPIFAEPQKSIFKKIISKSNNIMKTKLKIYLSPIISIKKNNRQSSLEYNK